jgi:hypothetical protein
LEYIRNYSLCINSYDMPEPRIADEPQCVGLMIILYLLDKQYLNQLVESSQDSNEFIKSHMPMLQRVKEKYEQYITYQECVNDSI